MIGFLAADLSNGTCIMRVVIVAGRRALPSGGAVATVASVDNIVDVVGGVAGITAAAGAVCSITCMPIVVAAVVVVVVLVVDVVAAVVVVVVVLLLLLMGIVLLTFNINCSMPLRLTICTVLPTFWPSIAATGGAAGAVAVGFIVICCNCNCCSCLSPLCVNAAFVLRNHSVGLGKHSADTRNGINTAPMITVHTKISPK